MFEVLIRLLGASPQPASLSLLPFEVAEESRPWTDLLMVPKDPDGSRGEEWVVLFLSWYCDSLFEMNPTCPL